MRPIASLFWFGVLLLGVAVAFLAFKYDYLANGVRVQGTVIGTEKWGSRRGFVYHPVVEFVAAGRTQRITGSLGLSPNPYHAGERVSVIYLPNDPKSAVISDVLQMYLIPLLCGSVGGVCLTAALIAAYCTSRSTPVPSLADGPDFTARAA